MHTDARAADAIDQRIDRENPWPGLSSFTEENALFFHGRTTEAETLFRLIKREVLTVLFGLSGLGKTSLLQAGVFPRLRRESYLPVYIRLAYAPDAPGLVEQVKQALGDAAAESEISCPPIVPGETLWAFFHREANDFKTGEGRVVTPVLIFDQFEEMFTLGANSDDGQRAVNAFLTEIADLIENRPPQSMAAEIDSAAEEAFAFYKTDYKVVFTLREDFLANLEGLSNQVPSLASNRFRLQKMNGAQALEVITLSGGALVTPEVAERMVKMVAGRDPYRKLPLETLEIEPTLLSVFCRELNNKRLALGDATITPQLLSGSKEEILVAFYERALKGFDERLRYFVEDQLLTGAGYRNSVDLEDALAIPGVSRDAIFTLIDRRLLRIEDSARMPRVELTHDVLTDVIKKSRDDRQARQAAARSDEQVQRNAEQLREKDRELRDARQRQRTLMVLYIVAIFMLVIAVWQWIAATEAKHQALDNAARIDGIAGKIRKSNDSADVFIANTFDILHRQLSDLGRVDTLEKPADAAVDLLKQQAIDEGGMSDVQLHFQEQLYGTIGDVYRATLKNDKALEQYNTSVQDARELVRRHPKDSDPDKIRYEKELAEKLSGPANTLEEGSLADALAYAGKSADVAALYDESEKLTRDADRLASSSADKIWVSRQMGNIIGRRGDILRQTGHLNDALALYQKSLELRHQTAVADPTNETCQFDLASALSRVNYVLTALGRYDESLDYGLRGKEIRSKYAQLHPDSFIWRRQLFYSDLILGRLLTIKGRFEGNDGAAQSLKDGLEKGNQMAGENPANAEVQRDLAFGYIFLGNLDRARGDWTGAEDSYGKGLSQIQQRQDVSNRLFNNFVGVASLYLGDAQAHRNDSADALKNYQAALGIFSGEVRQTPKNGDWQHNLALVHERMGWLAYRQGNSAAAADQYKAAAGIYQTTLGDENNPNDPVNLNSYAWLLATCPLKDVRNGPLAVQAAAKVCTLTNRKVWEFLDTLAAADAAASDFKAAKADEQAAINAMGPDSSDPHEMTSMKTRLAAYAAGRMPEPAPLDSNDR